MSSSPQITEPSERLVSGQPTSVSSPHRETLHFDTDYRYAEAFQNPHPGIVAYYRANGNQSNTRSSQAGAIDGETAHEPYSFRRPDSSGPKETIMQTHAYEPEPKLPWYQRISRLAWLIITLTFLGVLAVLFAILGAMGYFSGQRSADPFLNNSNPAPSLSPSGSPTTDIPSVAGTSSATTNTHSAATEASIMLSATTSSSSSTSAAHHPTTTTLPDLCLSPATFLTNITWAGTLDPSTSSPTFTYASTAQACCAQCAAPITSTPPNPDAGDGLYPGCAAWLFRPQPFTPCTLVLVTRTTIFDKGDAQCPKGHVKGTVFAKVEKEGDVGFTAGLGPCSERVVS